MTISMKYAWHFLPLSGDLRRADHRSPADGETIKNRGTPKVGRHGLHAAGRLIDALKYAPGPALCRVRVGGIIARRKPQIAATERTIIWRIDGEESLRLCVRLAIAAAEFAIGQAHPDGGADSRVLDAVAVAGRWAEGQRIAWSDVRAASSIVLPAARTNAEAAATSAAVAAKAAAASAWSAKASMAVGAGVRIGRKYDPENGRWCAAAAAAWAAEAAAWATPDAWEPPRAEPAWEIDAVPPAAAAWSALNDIFESLAVDAAERLGVWVSSQ